MEMVGLDFLVQLEFLGVLITGAEKLLLSTKGNLTNMLNYRTKNSDLNKFNKKKIETSSTLLPQKKQKNKQVKKIKPKVLNFLYSVKLDY